MSAAGSGAPESASNKGTKADARDICYHDRVYGGHAEHKRNGRIVT